MKYALTAERIKEAMNDMHITQQELADKSNIGKSSISHYVNGSNEPGNKSAYLMAQVLKVDPAWLMGLDVPKNPKMDYAYITKVPNSEKPLVIEIRNNELVLDSDIEKALDLYGRYKNAIPQIQDAVEALLKPPQSDS